VLIGSGPLSRRAHKRAAADDQYPRSIFLLMHLVMFIGIKKDFWLSYQGHTTDALALKGDEGRGNLR
jgi:hypothetical protein